MSDPNVPPPPGEPPFQPGGGAPPPPPPGQPPMQPPAQPPMQPPAAPPPAQPPMQPPAAPPPAQPPGGYAPPPAQPPGGFAPPPAQPYQSAPMTGGQALAEPWKRIVSLVIDAIVLWIVSIPIYLIVGGAFSSGVNSSFGFRPLLAGLIVNILYFLYYALMIGMRGQTIGGIVLSIKVIGSSGAAVTQEQGYKRAAVHLLNIIPCLGPLAFLVLLIWGLIALFTQERRQTPWDQFADTLVVDA